MNPILKRMLQLLFMVLLQAALLFVSAGTLLWAGAWWYLGLYVGMLVLAASIMIPRRPEVIAERGRGTTGGMKWDLVLTRLINIPSVGLLIIAGLDHRFGWSAVTFLWLFILGVVLFILGYALVLWAMDANKFFSQVVRIQQERGHAAVTEGPYRFIRHPGYFGMLLSFFGSVILLGSLWGWLCLAVYAVLLVVRTKLEDRSLQAELPGYAGYAQKVKYRLLPGVW